MDLNPLHFLKRRPRALPVGAPIRMVVLLNDLARFEAEDIHAHLYKRAGARHALEPLTAARSGNTLTVQIDDEVATLATVPMRFSWPDLEGPCATAWWWPGARSVCEATTAHLVVTLEGGEEPLPARFLRLTSVTAATLEATRGVAVFCPSGTVVQPADNFIRSAARAGAAALPLHLWVEFRLQEIAPGTTFLATTGLEPFGHREIEAITRHPGREAHHRVFNFADFLMRGGRPTAGTPWGMVPGEQIEVRVAASQWDRPPVWRLVFAGDAPPHG